MTPDEQVVAAMGEKFSEFQKLALMCQEQPATRPYVEGQMKRLLEGMTPENRIALRKALMAAGAYARRRRR